METAKGKTREETSKLSSRIDAFEKYNYPHARLVAELATHLAQRLGLTTADVQSINEAALLHDIGLEAMTPPYHSSSGLLSYEERMDLWRHAVIGEQQMAKREATRHAQLLVRWHHEWWCGLGYPDMLAFEDIPIGARILRAVELYCALIGDRPYRAAMSAEQAMETLKAAAGIECDPYVVKALIALLDDIHAQAEPPLAPSPLVTSELAQSSPSASTEPGPSTSSASSGLTTSSPDIAPAPARATTEQESPYAKPAPSTDPLSGESADESVSPTGSFGRIPSVSPVGPISEDSSREASSEISSNATGETANEATGATTGKGTGELNAGASVDTPPAPVAMLTFVTTPRSAEPSHPDTDAGDDTLTTTPPEKGRSEGSSDFTTAPLEPVPDAKHTVESAAEAAVPRLMFGTEPTRTDNTTGEQPTALHTRPLTASEPVRVEQSPVERLMRNGRLREFHDDQTGRWRGWQAGGYNRKSLLGFEASVLRQIEFRSIAIPFFGWTRLDLYLKAWSKLILANDPRAWAAAVARALLESRSALGEDQIARVLEDVYVPDVRMNNLELRRWFGETEAWWMDNLRRNIESLEDESCRAQALDIGLMIGDYALSFTEETRELRRPLTAVFWRLAGRALAGPVSHTTSRSTNLPAEEFIRQARADLLYLSLPAAHSVQAGAEARSAWRETWVRGSAPEEAGGLHDLTTAPQSKQAYLMAIDRLLRAASHLRTWAISAQDIGLVSAAEITELIQEHRPVRATYSKDLTEVAGGLRNYIIVSDRTGSN